jgi:hypothetical protein
MNSKITGLNFDLFNEHAHARVRERERGGGEGERERGGGENIITNLSVYKLPLYEPLPDLQNLLGRKILSADKLSHYITN